MVAVLRVSVTAVKCTAHKGEGGKGCELSEFSHSVTQVEFLTIEFTLFIRRECLVDDTKFVSEIWKKE